MLLINILRGGALAGGCLNGNDPDHKTEQRKSTFRWPQQRTNTRVKRYQKQEKLILAVRQKDNDRENQRVIR